MAGFEEHTRPHVLRTKGGRTLAPQGVVRTMKLGEFKPHRRRNFLAAFSRKAGFPGTNPDTEQENSRH